MKNAPIVLGALLILNLSAAAQNRVDNAGRLERLAAGVGWVSVTSDLRVPTKGWSRSALLSAAQNARTTTQGPDKTWTASLGQRDGAAVAVRQTVTQHAGKLVFHLNALGERDGDIEGVFFEFRLPASDFAGGSITAADKVTPLPTSLPPDRTLMNGAPGLLRIQDAKRNVTLCVQTTPEAWLTLTDNRRWDDWFVLSVTLHRGNLPKGQNADAVITVWAEGNPDLTDANVALDPTRVRYRLIGNGGNYCFGIDSPVAKFTLENLKSATARTEMSLRAWAPQKNDAQGYASFAKNDTPASRLRQEFQLMARFTRDKIPFTTSIWRMPAWMTEPASDRDQTKRRISDHNWADVLHAVGAYLLYAKEKYAAEPDYFSFNEPDIGIDILFTPDQHRDSIKRFGQHFQKLGLRTKLILGDTANARGTDKYCLPTANDPEAMKHVGAVAFHSWNGASPEQYAAWADLAERLNKPLLVNEAGVDPFAWRGAAYRYFNYFVREMVHYQELLLHARPQSIIYWEFTGDYSLLASEDSLTNSQTERFCLQKHWCELTPPGSQSIPITSDNPAILATAFHAPQGYSIHLANPKWARSVVIRGLPNDLNQVQIIRTARGQLFQNLGILKITNQTLTIQLPPESLTTLTTIKAAP